MSRTSQALKRLGVAGVAVATIGAGVPAFFATAAQANHTTTAITLSPDSQTTPEDTCQQYTATVTFNNTTGADTATIDVVADPRANEDVEFCELSGTDNGTSTNLGGGTTTFPTGNTNGTTTTFRSGGGPGVTENREFTVQGTAGSSTASVTFGVVSDRVGTVDITAFLENTNTSTGNGVRDNGELGETSVGFFTLGGSEGVERVDAEPETGAATQGQAYTFTAQVFNAATGGQPIAGVIPEFKVISGPDAGAQTAASTPCNAPTDQNGRTTCTLTGGGATPGTDTIRVFVDQADPDNNPATNDARDNLFDAGEPFDDITVVFSSPQAAGTQLTLTCESVRTNLAGDACDNPVTTNSEVFTALVRNAAGTPLSGVPVRFSFTESGGSDAAVAPNDVETITPQCTTGADGTCTATLNNPRVTGGAVSATNGGEQFLVTAAVEVSSGSGNCPGINNVANNSVCDTATKRFRTPDETEARTLTLTPETQTVPAQGGVARVTATVVDRSGIAVPNVVVNFTEDGTGRFFAANSANTATCTTGANGTCAVELSTTTAEGAGTTNITATIAVNPGANNDECEQTANNTGPFNGTPNNTGSNQPGAPAGDCDDTAVVNFTAPQSPTATPTASNSPGGQPSTPPGCSTANNNLQVRVNTPTINATGLASVTVTGAAPGQVIELQGYSQNHFGTRNFANDPTPVDRTAVADSNGSATFSDLRPASNTRVRARQRGCAFGNIGAVINVRTQITLQVVRNGVRTYTFSGRTIPAREGGLIVTLYRGASEVLFRQTRATAGSDVQPQPAGAGLYSIRVTFPLREANTTQRFVVKTGQDAQNAPGRSNVRLLRVF